MPFILSQQRHDNVEQAFRNYHKYILSNKATFPPSAYELATSDWYFSFDDHKAPHDAWLEELIISEHAGGARNELRNISIRIKLLGPYHDGYIEYFYPRVFKYDINNGNSAPSHGDWRFDEFRVSKSGNLIHEIEWVGDGPPGTWLIEANDVYHKWTEIIQT